METFTLEEIKDEFIGEENTPERIKYEQELKIDKISSFIKSVRKSKKLTQTELGDLVGMKKAQIAKIENGYNNLNVKTLLKVLRGLDVKLSFIQHKNV